MRSLVLFLTALAITFLVYPVVLSFARRHNIVDKPNQRKLQRVPVPVLGGVTIYISLFLSILLAYFLQNYDPQFFFVLALLTVLFLVGFWDDRKDISPAFRFFVEFLVIWIMMRASGFGIDDFHGLWGIGKIPEGVSIPLSLIAGVGIINAVNLIDGVDGYCSGFVMMASLAFALIFYFGHVPMMFFVAVITVGSIIPFFLHNVFGVRSKMFLGDAGSLMLGTLLVMCVFAALAHDSPASRIADSGLSLIALVLAVMAVPVFDTLRVMVARIIRGKSPFLPDKTHLHHLFIEMDFSHLATSGVIVACNAAIVLLELLIWKLGASVDVQVYFVVAVSLVFTCVFYYLMDAEHRKNDGAGSELFLRWCRYGARTHVGGSKLWKFLGHVMDNRFFGGSTMSMPDEKIDASERKPVRPDPRIR
ncbi:MAG: undecaprenyl/decaprenyl-phosphate alpha-N-acetylglucosaminyl 1-phosphate transferase [Bacteroidales bacterium]|nr:undecaprenyl/decaprenyl-phosphate alpha-N-acetylglucosaminyl 1-phosphate transferase [Bacteroidales bacterium]